MKYLLDTAVWCHLTMDPHLVPARIRDAVEAEAEVGLASVSILEAAILHRIGKLAIKGTLAEFFAAGMARQIRVLELSPAIAVLTNQLPPEFNGDPFDRVVAATAKEFRLVAVTTDPQIRDFGCLEAVEFYPFKPKRRSKDPAA